jgi:hypothetical protein
MGNIQDGRLDFENLKFFPKNWESTNFSFMMGVSLLRTNGWNWVGKTAVTKTTIRQGFRRLTSSPEHRDFCASFVGD